MDQTKAKIFCIGAHIETRECLKYLVGQKCAIDTLITLPSGDNRNVSDYYDLHPFCKEHGIRVIDTTNINSAETVQQVRSERPDYLFTLGWSQLFKEDFINCFSKFVVGTHPSKLPHGRGRAPLPWTVLEELKESAMSFFKIDTGIDTGKLILQRKFEIPDKVYVHDLYAVASIELAKGFYQIYQKIVSGEEITSFEQDESKATLRGKRVPSDGLIEFNRNTAEIEKLIRAVSDPYPGAYCYYKDQKVIFWEAAFDLEKNRYGTLGQILQKAENGILVQFADGCLWLSRPTFEDGQKVDLKFFRLGDKLGYNIQDQIFYLRKQLHK